MTDKPRKDFAAIVRDGAVEVLKRYGTPAGERVQAERIDPIETGDTPRIAVFSDQEAQTDVQAGGAPRFKTTLTLIVQCVAEAATQRQAVDIADAMIAQAKDALFGDPAWVKLTENLATARVNYLLKGGDQLIVADVKLTITCAWHETYVPRVDTLLTVITLNAQAAPNAVSGAEVGAAVTLPTSG